MLSKPDDLSLLFIVRVRQRGGGMSFLESSHARIIARSMWYQPPPCQLLPSRPSPQQLCGGSSALPCPVVLVASTSHQSPLWQPRAPWGQLPLSHPFVTQARTPTPLAFHFFSCVIRGLQPGATVGHTDPPWDIASVMAGRLDRPSRLVTNS